MLGNTKRINKLQANAPNDATSPKNLGHSSCDERGCEALSPLEDTLGLGHLDTWTLGLRHLDTSLGHVDTCTLGHLDTWTLGHLDTWRTLGQLDTCENTRNPPEIIKKNYVVENGPDTLGRLVKASGVTRDDI